MPDVKQSSNIIYFGVASDIAYEVLLAQWSCSLIRAVSKDQNAARILEQCSAHHSSTLWCALYNAHLGSIKHTPELNCHEQLCKKVQS